MSTCNNCGNNIITSNRIEGLYIIETKTCVNCGQKQEIYNYNIGNVELEPSIDITYLQNVLLEKLSKLKIEEPKND